MSSSSGSFPTESTTGKRRSPSARVAAIASSVHNAPRGNTIDEASDSEAETVVLAETSSQDDEGSRGRGGRGRASTEEVGWDSDDSDPKHSKRVHKKREIDAYSSELSSAPSAPSSPVRSSSRFRGTRNGTPLAKSQSHKQQQQQQQQAVKPQQQHHQPQQGQTISRKRKAPNDREHEVTSRARSGLSSKQVTRPSPYSPSPPPQPSNKASQTSHPSLRTRSVQTGNSPTKTTHKVKRKVPRPLIVRKEPCSEDRSPSSSRQGSPPGFPSITRSSMARVPGSPINTVNQPHKPKRDPSGRTLLHRAAHRGVLEDVITTYNQNKELLNVEDHAGYIPLHEASLAGHTDVVRFLLECGSCVDVQSIQELDTPLMEAVEMGHLEIVKLLLEAGADPKKRNKKGANAIECITEDNPHAPAIESCLKAAEQKRRSKRSSEEENRNSATIESHSSRDPSVASPVHDTAPSNSRQTHGKRKNARQEQTKNEMLWVEGGKTGLQKLREKAKMGDAAMVHAIIERGVVPDVESLIGAIKGGHDDTVSMLLAFGANADPEPSTSANTGKRNSEETPMLAAIGRGGLKILGYLIEQVNPLRKDSRGKTYMDIARERMGESWEEEVRVLQIAYDKALKASKGKAAGETKASDKSPKKLLEPPENLQTKRSRPRRDSNTSTRARKREESTQPKTDDNTVSERESTVEPKARARDPDSSVPGTVPKRRRLVSKKDLISEQDKATQAVTAKAVVTVPKASKPADKTNESRSSLPPKLKTESRDIDMLDIPEIKIDKRGRSDEPIPPKWKAAAENLTVKEAPRRSKSHDKESSRNSSAVKASKVSSTDPERKRNNEAKERDGVKRIKAHGEAGNGRAKERRPRKVESDAESESDGKAVKESKKPTKEPVKESKKDSVKESMKESVKDSAKESLKDQEAPRIRKSAKEVWERKKASTQEDNPDRAERKRKELEKKQRLEQQRKEEEEAEVRRIREVEEKEFLRIFHLTAEQNSIITKASEDSTQYRLTEESLRKKFEQECLEKIAEEKRLAELEEKRIIEEKLRLEEEERRRIAEEEELKRKLEEEARRKAAEEEERRQQELKAEQERLRLEEEEKARLRQLELQMAEEKRREEEEAARRKQMEEECRLAEIRRREALPYALRISANSTSGVPTVSEAARYMPIYVHGTRTSNGPTNGVDEPSRKNPQWLLNVQAALVLGVIDLSFADFKLEQREVTEAHRIRMWQLLRPMFSEPITFNSQPEEVLQSQKENKEKFLKMNPLFWIRLDEFNAIIQSDEKYFHLLGKDAVKTSEISLSWNTAFSYVHSRACFTGVGAVALFA
ncbi:hypothetical protein DFH27DRAFT_529150 [Peziza echinospora]|nr:hypothetical protein DFH27DRAFT_529150 [Peziza echinospora]